MTLCECTSELAYKAIQDEQLAEFHLRYKKLSDEMIQTAEEYETEELEADYTT